MYSVIHFTFLKFGLATMIWKIFRVENVSNNVMNTKYRSWPRYRRSPRRGDPLTCRSPCWPEPGRPAPARRPPPARTAETWRLCRTCTVIIKGVNEFLWQFFLTMRLLILLYYCLLLVESAYKCSLSTCRSTKIFIKEWWRDLTPLLLPFSKWWY